MYKEEPTADHGTWAVKKNRPKTDKVPEAKTETRFHRSGSGTGAERQRGGEIVDEGYRKDFYKKIFKKVIQNN